MLLCLNYIYMHCIESGVICSIARRDVVSMKSEEQDVQMRCPHHFKSDVTKYG